MYCSNCGKKVDEKAVVCVGCGCALKSNIVTNNNNGRGIASMVLGILAVLYCIIVFSTMNELETEIYYLYDNAEIVGYIIGTILIQSVLAIVGICLSLTERKNNKNGFNTSGLFLTLISFVMIIIQFIMITF